MRRVPAPTLRAARMYWVSRARQDHAAHTARQAGPADDRQDHHDPEVDLVPVPLLGQRYRQEHPEGQGGYRLQHLDQTLHHKVNDAGEVARHRTQQNAEGETDDHPDPADGKRNAAAVEHARKGVAPPLVGAERKEMALTDVHEAQVGGGKDTGAAQPLAALEKQVQGGSAGSVLGPGDAEGLVIHRSFVGVHERPQVKAARRVDEMDTGRRMVGRVGMGVLGAIRREELGEGGEEVEHDEHPQPAHRQAVLLEPQPHQAADGALLEIDRRLGSGVRQADLRRCHRASLRPHSLV